MVIIVLPAYNEADGIEQLLSRIEETLDGVEHRVVVVDDGSRDRTGEIVTEAARRWPVTLVTHEVNRGAGQAIHSGIQYACAHHHADDVVVTMDADNTQSPSLILTMLDAARQGADVVIAARFVPQGGQIGVPWHRSLLSHAARVVFRTLFPMNVQDYTSFYRMYRVGLLQRAMTMYQPLIESRGFVAIVELLLKLRALNPTIVQVPLLLRYDFKAGQSKMKILKTILEYGRLVARIKRMPTVSLPE